MDIDDLAKRLFELRQSIKQLKEDEQEIVQIIHQECPDELDHLGRDLRLRINPKRVHPVILNQDEIPSIFTKMVPDRIKITDYFRETGLAVPGCNIERRPGFVSVRPIQVQP